MLERLGEATFPDWLDQESVTSIQEKSQLPFLLDEYAARRRNILARMDELGADAIIAFRPSSVEYICGHHTVETIPQPVLLTPAATYLYVPDAEVGRALVSSSADNVLHYSPFEDGLALIIDHVGRLFPRSARVAVELRHTSVPPRTLRLLNDVGLEFVDGQFTVEHVRLVMSRAEIDYVERAAISTHRGVEAAATAAAEPGATDSSLAAAVASALFEDADSPAAFGPIVATGWRGGVPHSTWAETPLSEGTTFLEFAGSRHRYCAPVMRTLSRRALSADDARLAELAQTVLATVIDNARPGVPCSEVARKAVEAMGEVEDQIIFHYNFGYPVGLAHPPTWMDGAPFYITTNNSSPLEEGMVFHVPASFRNFGSVGVGLSHTFAVEEHNARILTQGKAEVIHV